MWQRAGVAFLVVLIGVLLYQPGDEDIAEAPGTTPGLDREPDVYGQDVLFNQLHPDGTLHYRLRADKIRQFNTEELTRLTAPRLHLLNTSQPPWDIGSKHGYIRKRRAPDGGAEEVVFLREEVELIQAHPENGLVTLRAASFYIYPDRQYAETDQDVMIDTEVGRTTAAGLKADLESGLLKLSSRANQRVHTIVLPEQFKKT